MFNNDFLNNYDYWNVTILNLFILIVVTLIVALIIPNNALGVKFLNLFVGVNLFNLLMLTPNLSYIIKHIKSFNMTFDNWVNDISVVFLDSTSLQRYSFLFDLVCFIALFFTMIFFLSIIDYRFINKNNAIEFPILILVALLFGLIILKSENFIQILLALEALAFVGYVLVGFEQNNFYSNTIAIRYLFLGAIPGAFFILGLLEIYFFTGETNLRFISSIFQFDNSYPNYLETLTSKKGYVSCAEIVNEFYTVPHFSQACHPEFNIINSVGDEDTSGDKVKEPIRVIYDLFFSHKNPSLNYTSDVKKMIFALNKEAKQMAVNELSMDLLSRCSADKLHEIGDKYPNANIEEVKKLCASDK